MKIISHKSLLFLGILLFLFIFLVGNNSSAFGSSVISETKLTASDGAEDDYFGVSVSISGDTLVVGADFDDDNGDDSGSAYVFRYNGSAWDEGTKLTASDGAKDDYFGVSVSIAGIRWLSGPTLTMMQVPIQVLPMYSGITVAHGMKVPS